MKRALPKPLKQLQLSNKSQSKQEPLLSFNQGALFPTLCDTIELHEDSSQFALIDEKQLLVCKISDSMKYLKKSCKYIDKLESKIQIIQQNISIVKKNTQSIFHNIVVQQK
ncbi:Hypothetical_protein [Hexamita inflata]|uniref:Hypothetical_protein n=1 Tax=Hexamita inflata TaxID=28002 RepID=A0AA86QV19_9EUKA|nr:Hypothetical protein HINF_LOCUS54229 [Hexamita inflata]